jgi:hypothetical protein
MTDDSAVYGVAELAPKLERPKRTLWAMARAGVPIEVNGEVIHAIKVGRSVVYPRAPIDRALGISAETEAATA